MACPPPRLPGFLRGPGSSGSSKLRLNAKSTYLDLSPAIDKSFKSTKEFLSASEKCYHLLKEESDAHEAVVEKLFAEELKLEEVKGLALLVEEYVGGMVRSSLI